MSEKKERTYYTLEFKKQVVDEYMRGEGNIPSLTKKYRIKSLASVPGWIHKYGYCDVEPKEKKRLKRKAFTTSKYAKELSEKFVKAVETGTIPKFVTKDEKIAFALFENEYLKKKLLLMGESENFIANLWSSKNLKWE